jgi:hypothetical protein
MPPQPLIEFEDILDDWHLLRKATLKSRKEVGLRVANFYRPHRAEDSIRTPLSWRKEALRNKWSGILLDRTPGNGSKLFGFCSVPGIHYCFYESNQRRREDFIRVSRIFNLPIQALKSLSEFEEMKANGRIVG